ncbi:substrate-binding periplasmic protein [Bowmanella dokdonensis]|uniref:Transporter substrate-binding domain-containing protein n=1 Tax=Bowmanella dokdonensis TaxID=751969 RepID=A0A939IP89_9ALTE|nr:transporter substrate-binding domain-containing protein [Bowmanella dokdonensis]MBN7827188.1 transporter substrate-binding domain-containing protein [Bowmanella dokdonensis]
MTTVSHYHYCVRCLAALVVLILQIACTPAEPRVYAVYSYHSDPPFTLPGEPTDLSRAWVERFNHWQEDIQLELVHIERADLNALVESGEPYLILWANPLWFSFRDPDVQASHRIFWDADIIVSLRSRPVRYTEPADLTGLHIGARQGHFYRDINKLAEQKLLNREDADRDYANYQKLLGGELDAYIMVRSSLLYWKEHGVDTSELFVAQTPHDTYSRHILLSQGRAELMPLLNAFIDHNADDPKWLAQLEYWGVTRLLDPFELELDELMELDADKQ